jgi:hypothetical protein
MLDDFYAYLCLKAKQEPLDCNRPFSDLIAAQGQKLEELINSSKKDKPFSELPEQERFILRSINNLAETSKNEQIVNELSDLNRILIDKNRRLRNANLLNWLSIPLAVGGLVTSIIFGLRSGVDYDRIQKYIDKVVVEDPHNQSENKDIPLLINDQ